jgi:phenylacetate-CoA ligase
MVRLEVGWRIIWLKGNADGHESYIVRGPLSGGPERARSNRVLCYRTIIMTSHAHADRTLGQRLALTEWLTGEELHAYQAPLLTKLVNHARRTTDFYKDRLDFDSGQPGSMERHWREVPILTRAEAVANGEKLRSRSTAPEIGPIVDVNSSGSTGMPFRCKRTAEALLADHALTDRMYRWWRVDGDKCLAQIAFDHAGEAQTGRTLTTRGWSPACPNGIKHFLSTAFDIDTQLDWLVALRPNYLGSYSGILKELAIVAQKRGIELPFELIFSFATVVDPDVRTLCRTVFGSEIADTYGAQEAGHIAAQCGDCGEYHISAERCLLEILRDDGFAAAPGEIGRAVVTPFYSYAMPLIRYELGDMVEAGAVTPSCGRGLPTVRRILGRYRNLFRFRDGTTVWPTPAHFRNFIAGKQFQVVQTDFDHIEIRYVPESYDQPIDLPALTRRVRSTLRQPVDVTVRAVDAIPRSRNGKYEDFVSQVPRNDDIAS